MTNFDKERLEKLFQSAKFQLELEGSTVTSEDERVMKGVFLGDLDREDVIRDLIKEEKERFTK